VHGVGTSQRTWPEQVEEKGVGAAAMSRVEWLAIITTCRDFAMATEPGAFPVRQVPFK
jgi:hypothetical protein